MKRDLRGRTVVVTGASSGIGRATAEAFARQGATVVLAARDMDKLEEVARKCRAYGARALAVETDVTCEHDVTALVDRAMSFGGIDIWVSNVGAGAVGAYQEVPLKAHEQVIRTNLVSHMIEAHKVIPVFLQQGSGIFVNMISLGGFAAAPYAAAYSASKFGLRGFSEALRGELACQRHIHICDIYPSFVDTPGIAHGANYTGRKLTAPPPLLNARKVADTIVRVARHPRPTTMIGLPTSLVRIAHAMSPEVSTRFMAGFMNAYFRRAPRAGKSAGNLFAPPMDSTGIDGGLRSRGQRATVASFAVGAAAIGLMALAWQAHYRGKRR